MSKAEYEVHPVCIKCGNQLPQTVSYRYETRDMYNSFTTCHEFMILEWLQVTCTVCGFSWQMKCKDAIIEEGGNNGDTCDSDRYSEHGTQQPEGQDRGTVYFPSYTCDDEVHQYDFTISSDSP